MDVLMKRFQALAKRGYQVHAVFVDDEVECHSIEGGDPNCCHPKYFDPVDGHGYTLVRMDDIPSEYLDALGNYSSQENLVGMFDWMEDQVLLNEGKAQERKRGR